jgi:hypothetical protein
VYSSGTTKNAFKLDPPGVSGLGCCTLSIQGGKGDPKRCPDATGDLEIFVESKRVFGGSGRARTLLNESTARPIGTKSSPSPEHSEPHFVRNDYDLAAVAPKRRKEAEHTRIKTSGLDATHLHTVLPLAWTQIRRLAISYRFYNLPILGFHACHRPIRVDLFPANPRRIEKPPRSYRAARRFSVGQENDTTAAPAPVHRRSRDTHAAPF